MWEWLVDYGVMVLMAVWIMCGIFASVGARQRGRSEFGWLLVGLVFGLFGLLVFAMPYVNENGTVSIAKEHHRPGPAGSPLWISVAGCGVIASIVLLTVVPNWDAGIAELEDSAINVFSYVKSFNLLEHL